MAQPDVDLLSAEDQVSKKRTKRRVFTGAMKYVIMVLAVILSSFHLYTALFGVLPSMDQRSFHVGFVLVLIFLLYPARSSSPQTKPSFFDWVFAAVAAVSSFRVFFFYEEMAYMPEAIDLYLGGAFILLIFEAGRRILGYILPTFCALFLAFAYFGAYIPGPFAHAGLTVTGIIEELYLTSDGLFGLVTGVSSTYIFTFILFGAFLGTTGTSNFFNDLAQCLTGHLRGGPAKIAVLASAFMGTVSGSTSANVATTGAFTIPLMKRVGYKPHFAGAVEAAASTGGQIMPPVMGAAAFIIADLAEVPYLKVVEAAVVPAILYFFGVWCSLSVEANRLGLAGLPKESLPRLSDVLVKTGYKAIPLLIIIVLLTMGRNPLFAASVSIGACILLSFLKKEDRMTAKKFISSLEDAAKTGITVAIACIIVNVVICVMGATGVTVRIGDIILSYTAGNLALTLLVTMGICTLLGMGMPTTPSYVLTAAVAVPALIKMGCNTLDVHFFVFYFACLSSVTPPVCVGAYTAAGLAQSDPTKTAFTAWRLALPGFIVPYVFMYAPELLLTNVTSWPYFVLCLASAMVGVISLAIGVEGFLKVELRMYERAIFFAAALCLITPGVLSDTLGVGLMLAAYAIISLRAKGGNSEPTTG